MTQEYCSGSTGVKWLILSSSCLVPYSSLLLLFSSSHPLPILLSICLSSRLHHLNPISPIIISSLSSNLQHLSSYKTTIAHSYRSLWSGSPACLLQFIKKIPRGTLLCLMQEKHAIPSNLFLLRVGHFKASSIAGACEGPGEGQIS